jgi:uncharacterized protein
MNKKIIITGATGLIGEPLSALLLNKGYDVLVFTRNISKAKQIFHYVSDFVEWDYNKPENWKKYIDGSYAVIHLAGASIAGKRVTEGYKKKIYDSKVKSTKILAEVMSSIENKPKVFLCPSGVNYYGDNGDNILTESSSQGNDFLAKLSVDWEKAAAKVNEYGVRRVSLRTSPVLSTKDGILKRLLPLFNLYLGTSLGNGKQWFPWIHIDDIVNTYIFALENEYIAGPINATSPNPVRMEEFAKQFGKVLNRPAFFKVPKFALKLIAGEAADFITTSLRVLPGKLQKSGFNFKFQDLRNALADTIKNKK